ncbi:adenylate/guanylate cyclase domain-containing protein [Bacteroidota bacterium]
MAEDRRLAAIMFTDIVGYTALMGRDEDAAFKMLRKNRQLHKTLIEKYRGKWLKEMGDGILASFGSASDAVRCASLIQNRAKKEEIPLRIGIHEGEVVFEGGDIFGDGVNVASRLEDLAETGSINISEAVYREIKNKAGITAEFIEEKSLKNIEEPVKIYKVSCEEVEGEQIEITSGKDDRKSIAVLPFVNMSNDPEQEYFCDGISEEIINALSHIESLKVIARTSAFMFKGKHEDMRDIGRQLDVETLLEGSVRKAGDSLRITAQLIKASDGTHLWSEAYNRQLEDVFAMQEEISLAITDNLKINLLGKERKAITKRYTEDLEAYNLYLKGIYCAHLFTPEGFKEGMNYFERAIKIDPNFALPYYGMAYIFIKITFFGNMAPNEGYPIAKEYLKRAFDIDDDVAEAHATMGSYVENMFHWNWKAAEEELKKALQINPNSPEVHHLYSYFLTFMEYHDEAIKEAQIAMELDPLSSLFTSFLGAAYFYGHQTDKAIEVLEKVVKMTPNDFMARYHLGHAYEGESRIKEALLEYEKAVEVSGRSALAVSVLAGCHYLNGDIELAEKLNNELEKRAKSEYIPATMIYSYYNIKGDMDNAYFWLEKAVEEHDSFLLWMPICPSKGHAVPDEPRFKKLMEKVLEGKDQLKP